MSIIVRKDGKIIKIFTVEEFREMSFEEKYQIYIEKSKYKAEVFCECNGEIPLTFYYRKAYDEDIFLKNLGKKGDQHLTSCKLHSHYIDSIYELGYDETEQGDILVSLADSAINQKKRINRSEYVKDDRYGLLESINRVKPKVTLFGLTTKLLLMSWHKYVLKDNSTPGMLKQYIKKCYGVARGFLLTPEQSLQDIWYGGKKKFETLSKNEVQYLLMSVISIGEHKKLKDSYSICLYDYYEKKPIWGTCPKYMVNDALFKLDYSIEECSYQKKEEGSVYRMLAAGFIKNINGFITFSSLCLVPIIPNGLWYENEFEYEIYMKLIQNKRLFHKAYTSLESYNNEIPTFYFDDCEKKVIGEVFHPRYSIEKKNKRITMGNRATSNGFWYWDTSITRHIPILPKKIRTYPFDILPIQDSNKVAVVFNYDKDIISKLNELRAKWNPNDKRWELDKEKLESFKSLF